MRTPRKTVAGFVLDLTDDTSTAVVFLGTNGIETAVEPLSLS
jgi:hypothetical protein